MLETALVVSLPTTFDAVAFKSPLEESIQKVANLGYDGVEIAVRDPKLVNAEEILELTKKNDLDICAIGTGQAYGQEGLSFAALDKEIREMAVERIHSQISLASTWGTQVIIGLIRGRLTDGDSSCEGYIYDALCSCCEKAESHNVNLTIEPINRYETNYLNTVEETIRLIEKVGSPNLKLLVDTFHMNIEEPSITDSIVMAREYISHVHVADSNRWAPGMGHIDFKAVFECLEGIGYKGFVSAEILPKPDPDSASRQAIRFLREILGSH